MVWLIVSLICGAIAAVVASGKGRSPIGWFFLGFLLGLIGIVIVAVLPNLKEEERRRAHDAAERRRLREQLHQERLKTEALRRHATARLDVHDDALGLDTRSRGLDAGLEPEALPATTGAPPPPLPAAAWHYATAGKALGPVPEETLVERLRSGEIGPDALVWRPGMAEWLPASRVPALRS
jgi:hypothetical protein